MIVNLQKVDRSISADEIHDAVRSLEKKDAVNLSEEKIPSSFVRSLLNPWANLPFWAAVLASVSIIIAIYLLPQERSWLGVRSIAGAVFLFAVPGFALADLLVQKDKLRTIERITISICLSIVSVVLIGIMLSYSELGVKMEPIIASMAVFSIAVAFLGSYRNYPLRQKARKSHMTFIQNDTGPDR